MPLFITEHMTFQTNITTLFCYPMNNINDEDYKIIAQRLFNQYYTIDDDAWDATLKCMKITRYKKGELVYTAGQTPTAVHFVLEGFGRCFYTKPNGEEINKSFVLDDGHGIINSLKSSAMQESTEFSAQALSPMACASIDFNDYYLLVTTFVSWRRLYINYLTALALRNEAREAEFLLYDASERYQNFLKEYGENEAMIPNYHIASYLGITEVSLSRIRKKLAAL